MAEALIATTRNAELQALGTGGQLAIQAWEQIAGYLRRQHGPAHAALLAEPNPDPTRGVTDWYSEHGGQAIPIGQLPPEQQAAARETFTRLVNDIRRDVERLRASRVESERFLGELLALTLIIPAEDCLRVIEGQPILIAWAHAPSGAAPSPELLIGQLAGRSVASPVLAQSMRILDVPAPAAPGRPWRLFALGGIPLLLVPLLLFLLLVDPFHWFAAPSPVCALESGGFASLDELRQEVARESTLRGQIAQAMLRVGDRRTSCPPPAAPVNRAEAPPLAATPVPPSATADVRRATDQGAKAGKVQVVLVWDDANDLDLVVVCPGGAQIAFNHKRACGGELDLDQNMTAPVPQPVENIVFKDEIAPGTYRIAVINNRQREPGDAPSPFRVTVHQDGVSDRVFTGTAPYHQVTVVGEFVVPSR